MIQEVAGVHLLGSSEHFLFLASFEPIALVKSVVAGNSVAGVQASKGVTCDQVSKAFDPWSDPKNPCRYALTLA